MKNTDKCLWEDEDTGACTNDEGTDCRCELFEPATPQLEPEDMFKAFYMILYNLGGEIDISMDSFAKVTENMNILSSYCQETGKFTLETSYKPPRLVQNRKLKIPKKKLVLPPRLRSKEN